MDTYESNLNKSTISYNNLLLANSYKFKVFDIVKEYANMKNMFITITSKRRTGKSVLLKDLCYKMKNWYSKVYVFSMTAHLQPDLFDFVEDHNIFNGFNEEKLNEIWDSQEKLFEDLKGKNLPPVMIILDDIISDPNFKKSEIMFRLAVMGRHLQFCVVILTQNFTSIDPKIRKNVDLAMAFYLDDYDNREQFAKSYLSTKNPKVGVAIFERITREPYQAIVVMNSRISQSPEDTVRTYKAELELPKFMMGSRRIKLNHKVNAFVSSNFPSSGLGETDFMPPIRKI